MDESILSFVVPIKTQIHMTELDVQNIFETALFGPYLCTWIFEIRKKGEPMGQTSSQHLANGGAIEFVDMNDNVYELTLEKFVAGFKKWVTDDRDKHQAVTAKGIDCRNIDSDCATEIIQYALFGELVFD